MAMHQAMGISHRENSASFLIWCLHSCCKHVAAANVLQGVQLLTCRA